MRKRHGAMIVGLFLVSSCGGEPESETITIRFLRHENPNYVTADQAFFKEYEAKHPNVKIVDPTVDFHTLWTMLLGDLKRDQFPYDLVLIPPSRVCGFAENLTDVPDEVVSLSEAQNSFYAAPLAGSTCGGKLKALPVEYNLEYGGVVVNVDKYKAKFDGRTPAWPDWATFIAEASMLTEYENGQPKANGLDIDPDWPEAVKHIFLSQILQREGTYLAPGGELFDLSTPAAHDSLAAMVSWLNKDNVMFRSLVPDRNTHVTTRLAAGATGYGWGDPNKPLSVMGYVGTAGLASTLKELPTNSPWHFDFFQVPPMVGTKHKFVQNSGWAFAVPRNSKNPKVAWDIAKSLALDAKAMRQWSKVTGALPALKANNTPEAAAEHPSLSKVSSLLENGVWLGYVPNPAHEVVAGAFTKYFFEAVAGKDIDQALAELQKTANDAIVNSRGQ